MESTRALLAKYRQRREHASKMLEVTIPTHVDDDMIEYFAPVYAMLRRKLEETSNRVMELERDFEFEIAAESNPKAAPKRRKGR